MRIRQRLIFNSSLFFSFVFPILVSFAQAEQIDKFAKEYKEALLALNTGNFDQALKQTDQLLKEEGDSPRLLEFKGRILLAKGSYQEAEPYFLNALKKDPNRISPHFYLGELSFKQQKWAEAIPYYTVYFNKNKEDKKSILKLIYCRVATQHFPEAGKLILLLSPIEEYYPHYYFARAAIAFGTGKKEEYLKVLRQAQTIYGNDVFAEYQSELLFLIKYLKSLPSQTNPNPS